jgi:hypothetical protein
MSPRGTDERGVTERKARLPPDELVGSRVRTDPGAVLEDALDHRLTGYVRLEPQDALLGDGAAGVLVFEDGVPTLAYHPDGSAGSEAVAALATSGPCRASLHAVPRDGLPDPDPDDPSLRVAPEEPAERLAGDRELADRTRRFAPESEGPDGSAVEAFLADEERIAAIREQAREEAERRAEEWGFQSALE